MSAIDRLEEKLERANESRRRMRREVDEAAQEVIGDGLTFAGAYGAGFLKGSGRTTTIGGIQSNTVVGVVSYFGGFVLGGEAGQYVRAAGRGFVAAEAARMGEEHGADSQ